jgi:hypothetical protein
MKVEVTQTEFDLPEAIFGRDPHRSGELLRARGVLTDPLLAIALSMVDPNVVGEENENISFGFERKLGRDSSTGKKMRQFSDFTTGKYFINFLVGCQLVP